MATMSKWPTGEFRFISLCHLGVIYDTPNQPCITKRVSPVSESAPLPRCDQMILFRANNAITSKVGDSIDLFQHSQHSVPPQYLSILCVVQLVQRPSV